MGKPTGSQVCGHNECLLYLLWTTFGGYTRTGDMGETFPVHPGIERRLGLLATEWSLIK